MVKRYITSFGAARPPHAMHSNTSVAVIASDAESLKEHSMMSPKKLPARKKDALQLVKPRWMTVLVCCNGRCCASQHADIAAQIHIILLDTLKRFCLVLLDSKIILENFQNGSFEHNRSIPQRRCYYLLSISRFGLEELGITKTQKT